MIVLVPVAFTGNMPLPERSTPVVWVWLALVVALFVLERVVVLDQHFVLHLLPAQVFAGVTFVVASWGCYSDSALFAPWQLWSHILVHPSWWQLGIEIVLMLVIGRAVERMLGSVAMAMALLTLIPMSATLFLLFGGQQLLIGGHGLCLCVLGLAAGREPRATIQWGAAYWIIVAVGYLPLFVLALPTMIILYVIMMVWLAPSTASLSVALWGICSVLIGIIVGLTAPRLGAQKNPS
jgi:membrane associated rhomboid family serine protease